MERSGQRDGVGHDGHEESTPLLDPTGYDQQADIPLDHPDAPLDRPEDALLVEDDDDDDDGGDDRDNDRDDNIKGNEDFAHLPWYRRPSFAWILVPYLLLALIYGGIITPKIDLIVDLVCRQYYEGGSGSVDDDAHCRDPRVTQRVSLLMLLGDLLGAVLPALVSPRLGALSDVYGRKPILVLGSLGTMGGELVTMLVAMASDSNHPMDVRWMLLAFFLDGVTGSAILAMAMVNTYAADCVPAHRRATVFGYFQGCACIGIALGPILAGSIVAWSGRIVTVFWILLAVHVVCALFVILLVPESVSPRRRERAREKAAVSRMATAATATATATETAWSLSMINPLALLEPLKILYPTGPGSSPALRRNLVVLAAVDTMVFGVSMGSANVLLIYVHHQFGWDAFASGRYLTMVNSTRVVMLMGLLPVLTHFVRRRKHRRHRQQHRHSKDDGLDLGVIRFGVALETCGWIGYSLAGRGDLFTAAGMLGAVGSVDSPALQSALVKHVPADQTGQLLGATGLLHALTQIVAPVIFNAVFVATVATFSQAVFVCLAVTYVAAFFISWMVKPHVFHDPGEANDGRSGLGMEDGDR